MSNRKRKNYHSYRRYTLKIPAGVCEFCAFTNKDQNFIEESNLFWVVKNIMPYDVWDTAGVKSHLMIVPKRHVDSIFHFNDKEKVEFISLLGQYEAKGYSVYARAPNNSLKSVVHQHIHLIAIDNKLKKFLFFIHKPRILWVK